MTAWRLRVLSSVDSTVRLARFWISPRTWRTSAVERRDCSASDFTSLATTANPLPCSPARVASIAALSASTFVCSARSSRRLGGLARALGGALRRARDLLERRHRLRHGRELLLRAGCLLRGARQDLVGGG